MESWLAAVKNCYAVKEGTFSDELSFGFYGFETKGAIPVSFGKDQAVYSWKTDGVDYLFGAGRGEKASVEELQDKLESVFDNLLGADGDAILYAARYLAIDDMHGLEVCGETPLNGKDTVFYGLYLADDKEGFFFTGFGSAEAEIVFDELTGAARHFYRKHEPATIYKGKSDDAFFVTLRALSCELLPDKQIEWDIFNATFLIADGSFETRPAIIVLNKGKAIAYNQDDIYDGKDFGEVAASFLSNFPSLYDISGFTITNFKDGRYGLTYYPLGEDDFSGKEEEAYECGDNCDHEHNKRLKYDTNYLLSPAKNDEDAIVKHAEDIKNGFKDMDDVIERLSARMTETFPGDWECGMGLITSFDETPVLLSFHTSCGPFIKTDTVSFTGNQTDKMLDEINRVSKGYDLPGSIKLEFKLNDEDITSDLLFMLGEVLEDHYPGWNAFAFSFTKGEDGKVDLKSVKDEAFNFDVFIDAAGDFYEEDIYMLPIADYFEEEFNNNDLCVSYVTFKIALGEDGLFVVEPATAGTDKGVIRVESFNRYLPKIYSIAEDIFEDYEDCNTISVTIFPERKFGFYLEYTETPDITTRRNLSTVLRDKGLAKYEKAIQILIRDDFTALVYEVEVETSLLSGSSKLGGSADLPVNFPYPVTEEGIPFEFVAQINLEEIAPFDKGGILPWKGLLSFFFDRKSERCKVLYFQGESLELRNLPEISGFEDTEEYLPARLRFIPSISLPILGKDISENFFEEPLDREKYCDISDLDGKVKMFGYADYSGEEDFEKNRGEGLKLLLQVPSVPECDMIWGKFAATLYFWINEEDLKLLRFDKCFCVLGEGLPDVSI